MGQRPLLTHSKGESKNASHTAPGMRSKLKEMRGPMRASSISNRFLNFLTIALTVAAGVVLAQRLRHKSPLDSITRVPAPPLQQVPDWRSYSAGVHRLGPDSVAVTIVMFSDIRCPHCQLTWAALQERRRLDPSAFAFVYRHYPFKGLDLEPIYAAVCAGRQGRFEALYDRYVRRQGSGGARDNGTDPKPAIRREDYTRGENWPRVAADIGLSDLPAFRTCMDDPAVFRDIEKDILAANRLGVAVVPTLLINDQVYRGNPGLYLDTLLLRASARVRGFSTRE